MNHNSSLWTSAYFEFVSAILRLFVCKFFPVSFHKMLFLFLFQFLKDFICRTLRSIDLRFRNTLLSCVCVCVNCSVVSNSATSWTSPPGSSVHGILEWVAVSFSRATSQPRDQTPVSCIAGAFFTVWATGEAHIELEYVHNADGLVPAVIVH